MSDNEHEPPASDSRPGNSRQMSKMSRPLSDDATASSAQVEGALVTEPIVDQVTCTATTKPGAVAATGAVPSTKRRSREMSKASPTQSSSTTTSDHRDSSASLAGEKLRSSGRVGSRRAGSHRSQRSSRASADDNDEDSAEDHPGAVSMVPSGEDKKVAASDKKPESSEPLGALQESDDPSALLVAASLVPDEQDIEAQIEKQVQNQVAHMREELIQQAVVADAVPVQEEKKDTPLQHPIVLGRKSAPLQPCPVCRENSQTRTETQPSLVTWLFALLLVMACWPLCWLPLVMPKCKQTNHYCVRCQAPIGQTPAFQDGCC